jgi:tetraacyldisaccharide 4'-kinase
MGGRGKTPVVAHLARMLVDAGERPAVLSRGYRRRRPEEGVVVVSDGKRLHADLDRSGDEPLMLARAVPGAAVLVCEVRAMAASLAEQTLNVSVHLLDDGFQHRSLERDVDIVLVAPEDLDGRRMPFGLLRSPVSALGRAHAVVVDGPVDAATRDKLDRVLDRQHTTVFSLHREVGPPEPLESSRPWPSGQWPAVVVAGIARPERFVRALEAADWSVVEAMRFADHHPYRSRDLARIADVVRTHRAQGVLTTPKDAVRLLPLRPFPVPIGQVPLAVSIDPAETFRDWLFERLREART